MCSELGQILNRNGSSMTDNTCRCDYTAGFAFVTEPKDKCFCTPTVEDCMCYIVGCQNEMQLNQGKNNKYFVDHLMHNENRILYTEKEIRHHKRRPFYFSMSFKC